MTDHANDRSEKQSDEKSKLERQDARDWIDLKISSLRSEVRMLFALSVAGNQILYHVGTSTVVGYASGAGIAAATVIVKGAMLYHQHLSATGGTNV